MSKCEYVIWGLHAGRQGEADKLFLKKDCISLGWSQMGDLGVIKANREAFKDKYSQVYPGSKPGRVAVHAGQLYRYVHEMKEGDLVVYPSKVDRLVHICRVEGPYKFTPSLDSLYPNIRSVKWLKSIPRTSFTQGLLYEIGSAMSLFQVKNYADEIIAKIEQKKTEDLIEKEDETVSAVAEDIEETTRDFILKRLSQELKGHPLAEFVAHLLEIIGYRTRVSQAGPDGGIDIVAHKDVLGFEPPIIKVQVKSGSGSVGDPEVSSLYGNVSGGEFGLLITLGGFSNQARSFARNKSNLRLIDGNELVNLILENYENFNSSYKGLIPLTKVYVPQTFEE